MKKKCFNSVKYYVLPYKWEYIFGSVFVLIILWSEMYFDFFGTYRNSINFWYALFEGHPLSFYSYAISIAGATPNRTILCGAAYDFTIYALFAVWNFPAWLYERISGSYAESCFLFLAWGKLMLPVIAIVIARGMKKILELVNKGGGKEDAPEMVYAYLFSGILIIGTYFIGQYDIIGVMFAVFGVYYFLKKDYKKFYLFFAFAVSCKYLAFFLFICLVLIHEKRILYVIRNIALGCPVIIIEKLLFSLGKSYQSIHAAAADTAMQAASADPAGGIVGVGLLSSRIQYLFHLKTYMGVDVMSVFMFLVGLIWVYCYLQKEEETYYFYYKVIYIAFCINAIFVIYTASTPYWAVLMVPWMILVIYCRADQRKINILLETIGVGSFIVWHFAREPYFFVSENCEGMLLYYLLGKPYYYRKGLASILSDLSTEGAILASPINMVRSVFYVCMLILLIINLPVTVKGRTDMGEVQREVGIRGLLACRTVGIVGVSLLPLVVYIIQVVFGQYLSHIQTDNQVLREIILRLIS